MNVKAIVSGIVGVVLVIIVIMLLVYGYRKYNDSESGGVSSPEDEKKDEGKKEEGGKPEEGKEDKKTK